MTTAVLVASALSLAAQAQAASTPMPDFLNQSAATALQSVDAGTTVEMTDLSGSQRPVQWPAQWKVCTQTPAAGEAMTDKVSLGVVKATEDCPA
ncbi:hypothetical protein [Streptomyces sp. NBC_01264]|uniref:hypothetical protein n=1 Tax=Streptomyces sp. NBC_01264 TaxID=2903804 RepID=UPI00225067A6|nr:hypothetical protein [Streptomyces sp. NBC_01264]MCX4775697.1 hypothetical protein [Streptomyces sp. NBC_01264]